MENQDFGMSAKTLLLTNIIIAQKKTLLQNPGHIIVGMGTRFNILTVVYGNYL